MKIFYILLVLTVIGAGRIQAQTVDEIINAYFEKIGGKENWRSLQGIRIKGKMKSPMRNTEIEMTTVYLKDGRQYSITNMQGREIKQRVFDGETLWNTNFMSGKAEKTNSEATENFKRTAGKDFPDPFLDYKEKGYTAELMGKETVEGVECFKIKLIKTPRIIDGQEQQHFAVYYFDTENYVPIAMEMNGFGGGGMAGRGGRGGNRQMLSVLSDYQEVEGLYFPFSRTTGRGAMIIENITLNPKVDDADFKMPEDNDEK
ncbi:MAG: outer membrane lipoprotein-sorting protein [Sinomicrobium sp.]|nr:outer membrane lipoprotein-sorting protein [Sinomicrobium sp.]